MRENCERELVAITAMQRLGCRMVSSVVIHHLTHRGTAAHPMVYTRQSTLVLSAAHDRDLFMMLQSVVKTTITFDTLLALCQILVCDLAKQAAELYRQGLLYIDIKLENALHSGDMSGNSLPRLDAVLCDYGSVYDRVAAQTQGLHYGELAHTQGNLDPDHIESVVTPVSYARVVAYALARDVSGFTQDWSTIHRTPSDTDAAWRWIWTSVYRIVRKRLRADRPALGPRICAACTHNGRTWCTCPGVYSLCPTRTASSPCRLQWRVGDSGAAPPCRVRVNTPVR